MADNSLCANCGTLLEGPYCSSCGQQRRDIKRFFLTLINDAFEDVFKLNSRAWKTLLSLLFKPGFLTTEYLKGRRASYIQPVRLYFFTSIIFFLLLSINNFLSNNPFSQLRADSPAPLVQVEVPPVVTLHPTSTSGLQSKTVPTKPAVGEGSSDNPMTEEEIDTLLEKEINIPSPLASEASAKKLNELLRKQAKKAILLAQEEAGTIKSVLLELAPPVVFCLLPLFALLLKFGYITRGIYYAEHLVFAIHCHAFIFLTLIFYTLLPNSLSLIHTWLGGAALLWIPFYLWLSLKKVYDQSVLLTSLKFVTLSFLYTSLLSAGILFALLIGVMTL